MHYNYNRMVKIKNFHEGLEQSLVKLGQEVEKQIESGEVKDLSEREIVKKSIQTIASQIASVVPQAATEEDKKSVLPQYFQESKGEEVAKKEIEGLIKLAFTKNLEAAVAAAKKRAPFVEDAFHDALVDKLLPELKKRGILKG